MKKRVNLILLAVFLLSLAAWAPFLLFMLDVLPTPPGLEGFYGFVLLFPLVPAFFGQLLLCRTPLWTILRLLPLLLLALAAFSLTLGMLGAEGWGYLDYLLPLALCPAPIVGCILAWAVYGLTRVNARK